jgi:antitoxin (DNA-binding transcriptional repressor) of toxin-antitoxin stability system
MTISKSLYDTKTHFSDVIRYVEKGNTVIVTKNNIPTAELTLINGMEPKKRKSGFVKVPKGAYNEPGIEIAPGFTDEEMTEMGY